ncbi:MAG TPA: ATP-binding protein [Steroidobacter sp.]|jgi:predicted kinase|nr:ATP-binding protein [Steroidobacter sp.]
MIISCTSREIPTALLVCGPPCAGKSTAARRLRDALGWPLLTKDGFKEALFESLGWSDRAWSKQLSGASYAVMFNMARELAGAGQSFVLEGNFRWAETQTHFASLAAVRKIRFVQVFCTAEPEILIQRWRVRVERSERHPGHVDFDSTAEIEAELRARGSAPLPVGQPAIVLESREDKAAVFGDVVASVLARIQVS